MVETVVGGLVVAAMVGLFGLAYRHPTSYRKFQPWLIGGWAGFCLVMAALILSLVVVEGAVVSNLAEKAIDYEVISVVREAFANIRPSFLWLALPAAGILLFMILDLWITNLRNED